MAKKYFGVDISEHNGKVNWDKLSKKVDFAILRIGWVGNTQCKMDKTFFENYKAAKKAGVKLGAYVYIYSKTTDKARWGAEWILKQIKGLTFDMPVYCDMEDATIAKLGKNTLTAITDAFNMVIAKGGYRPGIYANLDWFRNKLNASVKKYNTWIAHYTSGTDKYRGEYEMWQNSSSGKVDGVNGRVDTNYLYVDLFGTPKQTTAPATSTGKKSIDTIAHEVINGKWGVGEDRKKKLKAAGYDYTAVQKRVNEILKTPAQKTVTEIAKEVIAGKWGNGADRVKRLTAAGYDAKAVQKKVNELLK